MEYHDLHITGYDGKDVFVKINIGYQDVAEYTFDEEGTFFTLIPILHPR